jgi:hypothetical protein
VGESARWIHRCRWSVLRAWAVRSPRWSSPSRPRSRSSWDLPRRLNLFLFLFNLLPILPLDGGHVAGALYESVKRFIARVRGKPDPGPVDTAKLLPVAYVVAGVLLAVGVVVIWADLVKPITLG